MLKYKIRVVISDFQFPDRKQTSHLIIDKLNFKSSITKKVIDYQISFPEFDIESVLITYHKKPDGTGDSVTSSNSTPMFKPVSLLSELENGYKIRYNNQAGDHSPPGCSP